MSTVRISDDDKLILNDLCEKRGMTQGVVVGYLLEQAVRYNMFDSDWIEELTEVTFHDLLQEADLDYRKGFEVARYKAELNLKSTLIKELIKAMPPVERVAYLKETLGGHEKGVDLIESMSSQQMYSVNGEKKMIAPGQDGRPRCHRGGVHGAGLHRRCRDRSPWKLRPASLSFPCRSGGRKPL